MRRYPMTPLGFGLILLLASAPPGCAPARKQDSADREEVIAEISRLGGTVQLDPARPGNPVIEVALGGGKDDKGGADDEQLKLLQAFPSLQRLRLAGTRVTDDG